MEKKICVIIALIIMGLTFVACNDKEEEFFVPKKDGVGDMYSSYSYLGKIHNDFLTNIEDNFKWKSDISSFDEAIEYLSSFNREYTRIVNLYDLEQVNLISLLDENKEYYYSPSLCEDLYKGKFKEQLNYLLDNNVITRNDFDIVEKIIAACYKQSIGETSVREYYEELRDIETLWKSLYNKSEYVTDFTAIILNIAVYSGAWWIEHPMEEKLPPVVAQDAAGALVGGIVSGVKSYAKDKKVNWKSVAEGAITTGAVSSMGVVSKVSSVLKRLF